MQCNRTCLRCKYIYIICTTSFDALAEARVLRETHDPKLQSERVFFSFFSYFFSIWGNSMQCLSPKWHMCLVSTWWMDDWTDIQQRLKIREYDLRRWRRWRMWMRVKMRKISTTSENLRQLTTNAIIYLTENWKCRFYIVTLRVMLCMGNKHKISSICLLLSFILRSYSREYKLSKWRRNTQF